MRNNNYQKALNMLIEALNLAKEVDRKDIIALSTGGIGHTYLLQNKIDEALEYLKQSLHMQEGMREQMGDAYVGTLIDLGFAFEKKSMLDKALKYYKQAYKIYDSTGNQRGKDKIQKFMKDIKSNQKYIDIFNSYKVELENNNYQKAHKLITEALELAKEIDRKDFIALSTAGIGNTCLLQNKIDDALKYLKESLQMQEDIKEIMGENYVDTIIHIGLAFEKKSMLDKALQYLERAYEIYDSTDNQKEKDKIQNLMKDIKSKI
ncbi:MAG: tetratricopeptide repeat protein [Candidatus Lokiarchaeota archaeon]|nr:tetratricopeptide repeat protein [Candidatus Lokiarchaeota archaeon]